jgi:hypothetical protein
MYKPVIDAMIALPIDEWSVITVHQLIAKLEAATANDLSLVPKRTTVQGVIDDTVTANYASSTASANKSKQSQKETRTCYGYAKNGSCNRPACPFIHKNDGDKSEVKSFKSGSSPTVFSRPTQPSTPQKCDKCGENHPRKACKYTGKCSWCGKDGHKEELCHRKKTGGPKVLLSDVVDDGAVVRAHLFLCSAENVYDADSTNYPASSGNYSAIERDFTGKFTHACAASKKKGN